MRTGCMLCLGLLFVMGCASPSIEHIQTQFEKQIDQQVTKGDELAEEVKEHVTRLNELRARAKAMFEKADEAAARFERILREQEGQLSQTLTPMETEETK